MCRHWSINWVKTILDPTRIPLHLGFLWDTLKKTIALPEDKTTRVEAWAKKLLALNKTTQEDLECFVGTLISTTPAVWQAPLHYRALQCSLLISLKKGWSKSRSVRISHPCVVRELNWWASGGLRANRISPWRPPKPRSRSALFRSALMADKNYVSFIINGNRYKSGANFICVIIICGKTICKLFAGYYHF